MLKSVLFFVAIAVFSGCAKAQQLSNGSCPEVQSIRSFNLNKYLGRWYIVRVNTPTNPPYACLLGDYSGDRNSIRIDTKRKNDCKFCIADEVSYVGKIISGGDISLKPAQGTYPFNHPKTPNYRILRTDYQTYAAIYSCFDNQNMTSNLQTKWILTRDSKPSDNVLNMAYKAFQENDLSTDDLKEVDQSFCLML